MLNNWADYIPDGLQKDDEGLAQQSNHRHSVLCCRGPTKGWKKSRSRSQFITWAQTCARFVSNHVESWSFFMSYQCRCRRPHPALPTLSAEQPPHFASRSSRQMRGDRKNRSSALLEALHSTPLWCEGSSCVVDASEGWMVDASDGRVVAHVNF